MPVCKARLATTSDAFALVEKGNENRSLADALYSKHQQTLNWWLGTKAQ